MKKNNILIDISDLILVLSFVYLVLKINVIIQYLNSWIRASFDTFEIFYGIINEINESLYIPLWGITLSFAVRFCNYWIINEKN